MGYRPLHGDIKQKLRSSLIEERVMSNFAEKETVVHSIKGLCEVLSVSPDKKTIFLKILDNDLTFWANSSNVSKVATDSKDLDDVFGIIPEVWNEESVDGYEAFDILKSLLK